MEIRLIFLSRLCRNCLKCHFERLREILVSDIIERQDFSLRFGFRMKASN